jgi:DNA-binding MarR family transcriptional regulator
MTPKAEKALDKARRVGDEIASEALAGFSRQESEQLIALLQRVRGNLSRIVDR